MVDRDVFERRLGHVEEMLLRLRRLAANPRDEILGNPDREAVLERWLQLLAEGCIRLANHLIATRNWGTPSSYREAFGVLRAKGVLDAALAEHMEDLAGLRNVLVHVYLDLDHERLLDAVHRDLHHVDAFVRAIAAEADREG